MNCSKCKEDKELTAFSKDKNRPSGRRGTCKSCDSIKGKRHYLANLEKYKNYKANYYLNNRELIIEQSILYRKKNKDLVLEYRRKYQKERLEKDINFNLSSNLRSRLWQAIKNNQKVGSAVKNLCCSIEELKKHLEAQFQEGMSWSNYGLKGWHIDHIKPLASFDLTKEEEFKKACHHTNLQPLWASDNLIKGAK